MPVGTVILKLVALQNIILGSRTPKLYYTYSVFYINVNIIYFVVGRVYGLSAGKHGFHVHMNGTLTNQCKESHQR